MSEVERLRSLLSEGLDLCVRAKKLDDDANKAMIASRQTRCATPAMWVLQQYDRDLADWEKRARSELIASGAIR